MERTRVFEQLVLGSQIVGTRKTKQKPTQIKHVETERGNGTETLSCFISTFAFSFSLFPTILVFEQTTELNKRSNSVESQSKTARMLHWSRVCYRTSLGNLTCITWLFYLMSGLEFLHFRFVLRDQLLNVGFQSFDSDFLLIKTNVFEV